MKKLIILILLIFVFLAGCTQTGGGGGPGVTITSVTAIPSTSVEPGTPILLQAFIQNSGGAKATNVRVELLGLTDEWSVSPERTQNIGELLSADPSRGVNEGQNWDVSWDLKGPGKSVDVPYDATVHVSYHYETTLDSQLTAVTTEYYRQTNKQGGIDTQSVTAGPISITMIAPSAIISGGRIPVQFSIQNSGGGKVMGDTLTFITSGVNCQRNDVRLIKGSTATLYCSIDTGSVSNYKNIPVSVRTSYDYWIESQTSITVLKIPSI
jgi:hypothetical protein